MHLNGLKIFCFVAEMPQWLTQVSIIGQKIANLDTLFRFCGQAAEIEKAYDNNKKERKYFTKILIQMHCLQIAVQESKSLYRSPARRHFYGTENMIWADNEQLLRAFCTVLHCDRPTK